MRKLLLKILPQGLVDLYKTYRRKAKARRRQQLAENNDVVTGADIAAALHKAGITQGDVVMVHCSLSKIGLVQNGPQTLIDAVINAVGDSGTVMMPSFPAIGFNYDHLKSDPVFDIRHTPSKMGAVSEAFRKMPGVLRSMHPTDPVCAFGQQAGYLVKDHFGQLKPYNSSSPFYRLCALHGKIIMIGVDLDSLTNLHTMEDAVDNFEYPVYHKTIFEARLKDADGAEKIMHTKVHDPAWSKKRQCNALLKHFETAGFLQHFKIGFAACLLIDAAKMHAWLVENYINKGITMYTPEGTR